MSFGKKKYNCYTVNCVVFTINRNLEKSAHVGNLLFVAHDEKKITA